MLKTKAKAKPQGRNNRLSTKVRINDNMNFAQRSGENRSVLVIKEEPVGLIASNNSANFGVLATYAINPGQANTFPLLSIEAAEYETYLFELLEFFTVPLVSEYASGGQTGETSIAVNFNASLPQPASQTAQLTLEPCDANLPCLPLDIRCPKEAMHKRSNAKFVRTGNLPGQSDIKEYDVGNLFVTGEGLSATQFNVCRLFVRYRCRLFTRVNLTNQGAPNNNSVSQFESNAETSGSSTVAKQMLLATTRVNGLNAVNTGGSIVIPAGNYLLFITVTSVNTTANMTLNQLNIYKNGGQIGYTIANYEVGSCTDLSLSDSMFITSNGTDAYTFQVTTTYSGGSNSQNIILMFVSI